MIPTAMLALIALKRLVSRPKKSWTISGEMNWRAK